jgi:hypothetical protein
MGPIGVSTHPSGCTCAIPATQRWPFTVIGNLRSTNGIVPIGVSAVVVTVTDLPLFST